MLATILPTLVCFAQSAAAYRAGQVTGAIIVIALVGAVAWNLVKKKK